MMFCEVKNHSDSKREKEAFIEITRKALCLLDAQDGHYFVSSIQVLKSLIELFG